MYGAEWDTDEGLITGLCFAIQVAVTSGELARRQSVCHAGALPPLRLYLDVVLFFYTQMHTWTYLSISPSLPHRLHKPRPVFPPRPSLVHLILPLTWLWC